jgi:hypothetical protein
MASFPYLFKTAEGKTDYIAAIFYLVNCLQEYDAKEFDIYDRFPITNSIQKKQGTLHQNTVQKLIDELCVINPKLSQLNTVSRRSGFFLTHDIDTVYGAKNQNGKHALQNNQYHKIPRLLWNHYAGKPDWLNMDKIMALESQYGYTSTFYWLVEKDKQNADYDLHSPVIASQITLIEKNGFENGLHKSLREATISKELEGLNSTNSKTMTVGQRYHFLKFNLPDAWADIEQSGLKLDTSLGYSQDFGYRNSYGLPFMPFNLKMKRVFDFIEVPMNIMDGNFFYQGKTPVQAERELIDWLDQNKTNSIITINFHNNFFDQMRYAGYDHLYELLLKYFKEENLTCMSQKTLITEYYKPELYNYPL